MLELSFRSADLCDIPVVFSQCKQLIERYEDMSSIDYNKVIEWVKHKIESNILDYTCVYCGEKKVAYYSLRRQTDGWELDDLYVLELYRGKGIGTKIMHRCISCVDGSLYLYVFRKNVRAIRLYERLGFMVDREVGITRLIMRRNG